MPNTALGLLIFIVLLAPGLTYNAYRAASTPVDKSTALRELGSIALRSVACDLVALALFGLLHQLRPAWTPNVGALIRRPGSYARQEYDTLFWWGVGLLAFACLLALLAAQIAASDWWARATGSQALSWLTPRGGVTTESAWWFLFREVPGTRVYAGCTLDDGTYLGGYILSYSPDSDETENRELVLTGPVAFRGPKAEDEIALEVGAVTVSARRLQYLTVSYLPAAALDAVGDHTRRSGTPVGLWLLVAALAGLSLTLPWWPMRLAALAASLGLAIGPTRRAARRNQPVAAPLSEPPDAAAAHLAEPELDQTSGGQAHQKNSARTAPSPEPQLPTAGQPGEGADRADEGR